MRHHHHTDVFPERAAGAKGPDATAVLYLSEAAASHPAELAAPTVFPRAGVSVVPKAGALLAWANVHDDGKGTFVENDIYGNSLAGVEVLTAGNPTLRKNTIRDGNSSGIFVDKNGTGTYEENEIMNNARHEM